MQEITTLVLAHLSGDATLYPGLVPGGIYDRELRRTKPGATPSAFQPVPGKQVPRLRPSIVIYGPNDVDAPDGPLNVEGLLVLRDGFLRIHYYVPATDSGKAALDAIDARVRWLLNGWQTTLSAGYPATFTELEMTEQIDSETFPGNKQSIRRYNVEYLRPST